jgi:hypothetical protein
VMSKNIVPSGSFEKINRCIKYDAFFSPVREKEKNVRSSMPSPLRRATRHEIPWPHSRIGHRCDI